MAEFPLKRLNRLRKYAKGLDIEQYLMSEHRQNLKAIEDSFENLERQIVPQTQLRTFISDPILTTTTSTTQVVLATFDVDLTSDRKLVSIVSNRPEGTSLVSTESVGAISHNCDLYVYRDGIVINHIIVQGFNFYYSIPCVDLNPGPGTYEIRGNVVPPGPGTLLIVNMSLVVQELAS